MHWSEIIVQEKVISGRVIGMGMVAAITAGIMACSSNFESASSQEKNVVAETSGSQERNITVESASSQEIDHAVESGIFRGVDYGVKLKPKNDGTLDVSVDPGRKCEKNKHVGCMVFKKNTVGRITFHISGTGNRMESCADAINGNHKVITEIKLTAKGKPGGKKGVFNPNERRPGWLKREAFRSMDLDTGIAYAATYDQGRNQVVLFNNNSTILAEGELKHFWYKVTVKDCKDPKKSWTTDPRGDNEGKM